jgi:serine/threonine protein kinase
MFASLASVEVFNEQIGSGAAGKVYKGELRWLNWRHPVGVKIFEFSDQTSKASFITEAQAHQCTKHLESRYFAKVFHVQKCSGMGRIVMEYYQQNLLEFLQSTTPSEHEIRKIFKTICLGIKELHKHGIAHQDIKPENILMQGTTPYICDFGAMIKIDQLHEPWCPRSNFRGTLLYASPETQQGDYFNPFTADIWSLGILLHICLTRTFPLLEGTMELDLTHARATLSHNVLTLLEDMLSSPADKRPTISQVLRYDWLKTKPERT